MTAIFRKIRKLVRTIMIFLQYCKILQYFQMFILHMYVKMCNNLFSVVMLLLLPLMLGRIGLLYACIIYQYPLHMMFDLAKSTFFFHLPFQNFLTKLIKMPPLPMLLAQKKSIFTIWYYRLRDTSFFFGWNWSDSSSSQSFHFI